MIVVDKNSNNTRPKINGVELESIAVEGVSDPIKASQTLIVELVGQGVPLVQRLARKGATENDVREMLRSLCNANLLKRTVVIAHRFRDVMECNFDADHDNESYPSYCVVYPDETPIVFYDDPVSVHCGDDIAFQTIAYGIFPLIDVETANSLYVTNRSDQFVFGSQAQWCDIDVYFPVMTNKTIIPSYIDIRHVDIKRGPRSFVVRNRTSGKSIKASLRVSEGDVAFLREFAPQWLDRCEPISMKPTHWAHAIANGVFVTNGDLSQFAWMSPNIIRDRMRRAVHRANHVIEEIAIWTVISPEETRLSEIARIEGVWRALSPVKEDDGDDKIVHLPMTTDVVRFALELEAHGCVSIEPPIITEMHILISSTSKNGNRTTFLIPIDDGRFTW